MLPINMTYFMFTVDMLLSLIFFLHNADVCTFAKTTKLFNHIFIQDKSIVFAVSMKFAINQTTAILMHEWAFMIVICPLFVVVAVIVVKLLIFSSFSLCEKFSNGTTNKQTNQIKLLYYFYHTVELKICNMLENLLHYHTNLGLSKN